MDKFPFQNQQTQTREVKFLAKLQIEEEKFDIEINKKIRKKSFAEFYKETIVSDINPELALNTLLILIPLFCERYPIKFFVNLRVCKILNNIPNRVFYSEKHPKTQVKYF